MTYYAVTFAHGPISIAIEAESTEEAIVAFATLAESAVDEARTDAEDALDIDGADMTDGQFDDALREAGLAMVARLDDAARANSGAGWYLWVEMAEGDRVCAGAPGTQDYDTGRVIALNGDVATVAWDSLVRTVVPVSDLRRIRSAEGL